MSEPILVLNCGSSSIKFALFDPALDPLPRVPMWSGRLEGIGSSNARLVDSDARPVAVALDAEQPYQSALQVVRARVEQQTRGRPPAAVAHRVVHGGSKYGAPVRIDHAVLADLQQYVALAPLHQPYALQAIEVLLAELPHVPQTACFDTAFHRTLPQVEQMLPLPHALWERGVRRYGFHGLSYEYMAIALAERHGDAARGRTIVAHLGSGASLCAMHSLQSVATTMGFSALDGLMMGTRCGSLDPGVLLHLMEVEGLDARQLSHLLYHESGCSASPACRRARSRCSRPRPRMRARALRSSCTCAASCARSARSPRRSAASTCWPSRPASASTARRCASASAARSGGWACSSTTPPTRLDAATISDPHSRVRVVVEPTNEEWMMASHALDLVRLA
jgi:acetate kinase